MINPFLEVNWRPGRDERRRFAKSLMVGFPILALVGLCAGRWLNGAWPLTGAIILGGTGLFFGAFLWCFPAMARPFYIGWFGAACAVGLVISNVLFSAFYLLFFTAFGLLRRMWGNGALSKGFEPGATSYWKRMEMPSEPARYYRQF